ncbi:hypothetical protein HYALB_00009020 [Hymenoscyphus albidus]|uniref:Uncharacterized protein n=1 Tax=Hymenoscyphus albidus TaxID=595503 RepID=A0A9N9M3J5_9HELO|nr:hypothetical protein HYALB_00009020 [Hymenoscyphus albidus]
MLRRNHKMPPHRRRYYDDEGYPRPLNQRACKPNTVQIMSCCRCKKDSYAKKHLRHCHYCSRPRCGKCLFMVAEHKNIIWDHSRYEEDHPYDSQPEAYDEEDDVGDTGGWGQIAVETRKEEVVLMDDGDDSNGWGRAESQEEEIDDGNEGNEDTKKENGPTRDDDGDVEMTEAGDNVREEDSIVAVINFHEEDLYDA